MDVCAVCGLEVDDGESLGAGSMVFHGTCLPSCRFCERPYTVDESGWDFRGGVAWSDESEAYVSRLESAACGTCSDEGERRDYGLGW